MASSESFFPRTIILPPSFTGLERSYQSTRKVPPETALPVRGTALGTIFGSSYATNIILDSTQEPAGDGQVIQKITHTASLPGSILKGSRKIGEINSNLAFSEQIVTPPGDAELVADPDITYTPVNEFLSLKRTETAPTAALDAYYLSYASKANLQLPNTLTGISVVWQESGGNGSYSTDVDGGMSGPLPHHLSATDSGSAHGSASAVPELQYTITENNGSGVDTTSHFFFLPLPVTTTDIIDFLKTKLGVGTINTWPRFKPKAITLTLRGVKVAARANASGSLAYSIRDDGAEYYSRKVGEGTDYDFSSSIGTITIPPTLHAAGTVSGTTSKDPAVDVTAEVGWTGWGTFPSLDASSNAATSGSASITPTSITATNYTAIPSSGIYLVDTRVEPFDWGYARVFAETLDASIFA